MAQSICNFVRLVFWQAELCKYFLSRNILPGFCFFFGKIPAYLCFDIFSKNISKSLRPLDAIPFGEGFLATCLCVALSILKNILLMWTTAL